MPLESPKIGVIDLEEISKKHLQKILEKSGTVEHISTTIINNNLIEIVQPILDGNYDVIMINIECSFKNSKRADYKATELLFWLRLKEKYQQPIICYGFSSLKHILQAKPELVILNAPRNYYIQLPFDFDEIITLIRINNTDKLIDFQTTYRPFIKPIIKIEEIRHSQANYYALKNIKNIHEQITNVEINISLPDTYNTVELAYDNYYGANQTSQLEREAERNINRKIEQLESEINDLNTLLTPKKGSKGLKQKRPIDMYLYLKDTVKGMNPKDRNYNARINDLGRYRNIVNKYKNENEQKQAVVKELNKKLKNSSAEEIAQNRITEIKSQIAELRNLTGKVVLVDDLSTEGWYSIYKELMGANIELLNQEVSSEKSAFDPYSLAVSILSKTPNLVLLDMRLYEGEEDTSYPSGIRVLREIRKQNKIVPIIVCSVSNKGSIINLIHQEGANYYWLKEGIDLGFAYDESINNYERLIHLLKKTLSTNQVRLQNLYNRFQGEVVNCDEKLWWEDKDWGYSHIVVNLSKTDYKEFIPQKTQVVNDNKLHRLFIFPLINFSKYLFSTESKGDRMMWIFCSSIISDLSNIIEYIHRFDIIEQNRQVLMKEYGKHKIELPRIDRCIISKGSINLDIEGTILNRKYGRNDYKGNKLYKMRNNASHYAGSETLNIENVFVFIEELLNYLLQDNEAKSNLQYYEKNRMWYFDKDCTMSINTTN